MLGLWITFYCYSDPATHLGSFFGNAIADWSGSVIIILGTKYECRFVVDGIWTDDPRATQSTTNSYGGRNSVLKVGLDDRTDLL